MCACRPGCAGRSRWRTASCPRTTPPPASPSTSSTWPPRRPRTPPGTKSGHRGGREEGGVGGEAADEARRAEQGPGRERGEKEQGRGLRGSKQEGRAAGQGGEPQGGSVTAGSGRRGAQPKPSAALMLLGFSAHGPDLPAPACAGRPRWPSLAPTSWSSGGCRRAQATPPMPTWQRAPSAACISTGPARWVAACRAWAEAPAHQPLVPCGAAACCDSLPWAPRAPPAPARGLPAQPAADLASALPALPTFP